MVGIRRLLRKINPKRIVARHISARTSKNALRQFNSQGRVLSYHGKELSAEGVSQTAKKLHKATVKNEAYSGKSLKTRFGRRVAIGLRHAALTLRKKEN